MLWNDHVIYYTRFISKNYTTGIIGIISLSMYKKIKKGKKIEKQRTVC